MLSLRTCRWSLLACLAVFSTMVVADDVEYRKGDKIEKVSGDTIKDSINSIEFKTSVGKGKEVSIPSQDVIGVKYDVPGTISADLSRIQALEKNRDYVKALEEYKKSYDGFSKSNASEKAKRHIDYRIAMLKSQVGEADAVEKLDAFIQKYPNSWQTSYAAKQLALMYFETATYDKAITLLEGISKTAGLTKELKYEIDLLLIDAKFQSGKATEAAAMFPALANSAPTGPTTKQRLDAIKIGLDMATNKVKFDQGQKDLEGLIEKASDPIVKATAYNMLGDCFMLAKQPREAMWNYLYVDVVFNQDRTEQLKSLGKLARLFEVDLKDADKAKQFRDKAQKLR